MGVTDVEWADLTENWQAGCTYAGPECTACYAEKMSQRLSNMGQARYQGVTDGWKWTRKIVFDQAALDRAFDGLEKRRRPARVFLGSMTDLWHEDAPAAALVALADRVARLDMLGTPHRLLGLTKRAGRLVDWQRLHFPQGLPRCFVPGVTAGTQRSVYQRVPWLLEVKAHHRFVSVEPMLEPVTFDFNWGGYPIAALGPGAIDHVIVGCEAIGGRPGRTMDMDWVRALRDECRAAGGAFFLKQAVVDGAVVSMPALDGRTWSEIP